MKINSGLVVGTEYVVADAPALASWYRVKAVDAGANASAGSGALPQRSRYGSQEDGGVKSPRSSAARARNAGSKNDEGGRREATSFRLP